MKPRLCELCKERATVYCSSESALLCFRCDFKVHSANFIVARHKRDKICSNCDNFVGFEFSGTGCVQIGVLCGSCSPSLSDCVSTTQSCLTTINFSEVEGILVNWCGKFGLNGNDGAEVVRMGFEVFGECRGRITDFPPSILLAASFLCSLEVSGRRRSWEVLKRVEDISGIPGNVILGAEEKVARAVGGIKMQVQDEGWGEC